MPCRGIDTNSFTGTDPVGMAPSPAEVTDITPGVACRKDAPLPVIRRPVALAVEPLPDDGGGDGCYSCRAKEFLWLRGGDDCPSSRAI